MATTDHRRTSRDLAVLASLWVLFAVASLALTVVSGQYTAAEYVTQYGAVLVGGVPIGGALAVVAYRTARGRAVASWVDARSFWTLALVGIGVLLVGLFVALRFAVDATVLEAAFYGIVAGYAAVTGLVALARR